MFNNSNGGRNENNSFQKRNSFMVLPDFPD